VTAVTDSDLRLQDTGIERSIRPVVKMTWQCDVCHSGNVCDVPKETHLFAAILMTKRDHGVISPSCEWDPTKIHGKMFHPGDASHRQQAAGYGYWL